MRPAVYAAILGAGVGVGILVYVLTRRSSGGPKGRPTLGRSATSMLARRPSQPSAGGEARQYRAFVSHMKAEAAMEARFVQSEIETISGRCCFLDSDDLKDLSQLTKHVRDSEVLVLVQTKSVLTRPWVLIELVTAVRAGIYTVPYRSTFLQVRETAVLSVTLRVCRMPPEIVSPLFTHLSLT